ncbi:2-octaprenylphenol hydroxylase [Holospora obtusa F1]|uniref:2-octaprenylphenol hydroxylase n=1 Tax=Holospora obtusa F1 TaxID=1399147 RepID=W6TI26_HOLOB|nr:FAD-dependent monooxygenase [Holospora obtusa]ETZ07655.1 2-octaprenylphenol hydroxylase [Holospora obtusa F1]
MAYSTEIIIIGGGAIGLISALYLGAQGVSCLVLEKKSFEEVVQGKRHFAIAQDVVEWLAYWKIVDLRSFWIIQNAAVRMHGVCTEINFSSKRLGLPYLGVMVHEHILMEMLISMIENHPYVSVMFSENLERIWHEGNRIHVMNKKDKIYTGRCCIAADGKASWVRSQLKSKVLRFDFKQDASSGIVKFQGDAHTVWDVFFKDHCIGILPFSSHEAACILMGPSKKMLYSQKDDLLSLLNDLLHGKIKIFHFKQWDAHYPLTAGRSKEEVQELVLFLGDALEWMHPLMGQGMNLSLRYASRWLKNFPDALRSGICLKQWLLRSQQNNWKAGATVNFGALALQSSFRLTSWNIMRCTTFFPKIFEWYFKKTHITY